MSIKIALAGNPNCGKTTLFNALTGSNQFVGNWPGVTVEKKEGKLKGHKDVMIMDLPGIYSLSPYTLEEVVARNYLISERPDAIINIVDGTNIERNLYLSTQLIELGIPVIIAVNMMDIVEKNGDKIHTDKLAKRLGCEVLEISALKGNGIEDTANRAVSLARQARVNPLVHKFAPEVENAIAQAAGRLDNEIPEAQRRFFAVKLLEKDERIVQQMRFVPDVGDIIQSIEDAMDDDTESIITNERYAYITSMIGECVCKANKGSRLTVSDKIDRVVTNRILALPIFVAIMFLVYYIAMSTIGAWATDWTNDNLFGAGFHLLGIGGSAYEEKVEEFEGASEVINGFLEYAEGKSTDINNIVQALDAESEYFKKKDAAKALIDLKAMFDETDVATYFVENEETLETVGKKASYRQLLDAVAVYAKYGYASPDPSDDGIWVPGIPVLAEGGLDAIGCADWLSGLILDGIVAGVGAVLGFVPQMFVLFLLLAFLESCGYMARIAFIMDRIFRKFGLSGKSFIPVLIGVGCGVPGVMASRTIENERDRRMTIMTTTLIPCGAKIPFIAMIAGAIFGGSAWVATGAFFIGIAAIICSGIILKKTRMFAGDPAPFVMELPAYHMPTVGAVLHSMWERGWSFIKKAGTIILLSTILVWFATYFGFVDGKFQMLSEDQIDCSILALLGRAVAWLFVPQGFGSWQATVASLTGLVAKENIVGTMGILYGGGEETVYQSLAVAFTTVSGLSFMTFNLLCAPCFAAMGAIKREMNNPKWFWFAIGYQCGLAYLVSLVVYRIGGLITGACSFGFWTVVAALVIVLFLYLMFRPQRGDKTIKMGAERLAAVK